MYRYEFAGYLSLSNDMLDDVLAHPDRATVRELVAAGREHARTAERAFRQWDYLTAATHARLAYEAIATAAQTLGVATPAFTTETLAPINGTVPVSYTHLDVYKRQTPDRAPSGGGPGPRPRCGRPGPGRRATQA